MEYPIPTLVVEILKYASIVNDRFKHLYNVLSSNISQSKGSFLKKYDIFLYTSWRHLLVNSVEIRYLIYIDEFALSKQLS